MQNPAAFDPQSIEVRIGTDDVAMASFPLDDKEAVIAALNSTRPNHLPPLTLEDVKTVVDHETHAVTGEVFLGFM